MPSAPQSLSMDPQTPIDEHSALTAWARALEEREAELSRIARGGEPDPHRAAQLKVAVDTAYYILSMLRS